MQIQNMRFFGSLYILVLLDIKISSGISEGHLFKFKTSESFLSTSFGTDVFFEIIHPPELEYTYKLRPAKDFGASFNASFMEERIPLVPTEPPQGCQIAKNAKELKGRVALIERGNCSFFLKSMMAEEAGAKAVIISDFYSPSTEESTTNQLWADYYYVEMIRDHSIPSSKTVNCLDQYPSQPNL
ncbi:PRADC1-like protein [Dufourea novaeangliae]|uniref:PRADC1-like protein n=1 Tax=Dufourea novaeangliae TaxID=178035 RepID=A0A154PU52_DUFNO|nr:PRADC1-like protein [Dufourea novaeangliae]